MIDLKQRELAQWQKDNFGVSDTGILEMALGMSEEVGEIHHTILKGIQGIREGVHTLDKKKVANGVGDTLIYGMQLLTMLGLDAEKEISEVIEEVLKRDWRKYPINGTGEQNV